MPVKFTGNTPEGWTEPTPQGAPPKTLSDEELRAQAVARWNARPAAHRPVPGQGETRSVAPRILFWCFFLTTAILVAWQFSGILAAVGLFLDILYLGIFVLIVYVIVHFVRKYW